MHRFSLIACVLSLVVGSAGCSLGTTPSSASMTLSTGRSVAVTSDHSLRTIQCSSVGKDTESVKMGLCGPRKILIEPTAIKVDGTEVASIAESTRAVTVAERDGRLIISADGIAVFDADF